MHKTFLRLATLLLALAVALGAFGVHGLKALVPAEALATFKTGVLYHFLHALALLCVGVLLYVRKTPWTVYTGWFFVAGIACFSGSLYLLTLAKIMNLPTSILGPITPIGGLLFIVGWLLLFASTYQTNEKRYRKSKSE
ncbi:MAG: DUF423 domain-containing protein [Bacteroidetes bacterium]|nr:MAG: DUF423 domain-containing protein [Bacteroidota bacterium]